MLISTRSVLQRLVLLATLLPASAQAATLRGVQSGAIANVPNGTTYVAITPVDPSKAFLLFSTRHNYNEPTGSMARGRILSADSLQFVRVGDAADTTPIEVEWSVIEYASGVVVQRGEVNQTATTVNVTLPTPVGGLDRAFVTWSKTTSTTATAFGAGQPVLGQLTTTSNLQFRSGAAQADHVISWQVVEFLDPADILVQSGVLTTMRATALTVSATLSTAVDPAKTFVLAGYAYTGGGADIGSRMLRAVLTNPTTITVDRSTVGAFPGDDVTEIAWQAVELRDGSRVQGASENFATGVSEKVVSVASVDPSRSVAFASVQPVGGQNMGRSPYVADDVLGVGSFAMQVTSPTEITMTRNNTAASSDVGWFLVEFGDVADLAITKSVSDPTPEEGDPVAYTLTVTNGGPDAATGVEVADLLPTGVTFQSYSATQGSYVSGTGVWTVGSIANAASATLTLNATVDSGTAGTTILNQASLAASGQLDPTSSNDSATASVYVQSTAPDEVQITSGAGQDQRPAWSPDESSLVFDSDVSGNPDLYLVPSAGGAVTQLTTNPLLDRHPDWSPDGTQIVYSGRLGGGNPSPDLWLIPPSGGASTSLQTDPAADEEFPCWSRDGSQVAFAKGGHIWVVGSGGGTALQITTDPVNDAHPAWSPDGTKIVFTSDRSGNNDLWVVPSTGGAVTQITTDPASDSAPHWSADGERIAFQSNRGGNTDLWLIPATGGSAVRITSSAGFDVQPAWSPSGDRIAFARDGDLWIYSFPIDLAVTHGVSAANPDPGDTIAYTVTVSNAGPKGALGVLVTDILPAGLTFQSSSASQGSYDVDAGLWNVGDVPYGVTATLVVTCTVNLGTGGATIVCDAAARASGQADRDPVNDQASATVTVRTVLAVSSAANQSFFVGAPPSGIGPITITDDDAAPSINSTEDLRVRIPAGLDMTWDVADLTATIGGPAAAKVASAVTYEDAGKTLVLDVTTGFAAGDRITVSDLSFMSFATPSSGQLELEVHNDGAVSAVDDKTLTIIDPTGAPVPSVTPTAFALAPVRPNPFRGATTLEFDVPVGGHVKLRLVDVAGRVVRTLVNGPVDAGRYRPVWDGRNETGQRVSTGVYFVRLESGSYVETRKLVLLR